MLRVVNFILIIAIIGGASWTFQIKHEADQAAEKVAELQRQIRLEKEAIDILKAEWAYLNNPDRLQRIVSAFEERLGLSPVQAEQLITLDELPSRPEPPLYDEITEALADLDGSTTGATGDRNE